MCSFQLGRKAESFVQAGQRRCQQPAPGEAHSPMLLCLWAISPLPGFCIPQQALALLIAPLTLFASRACWNAEIFPPGSNEPIRSSSGPAPERGLGLGWWAAGLGIAAGGCFNAKPLPITLPVLSSVSPGGRDEPKAVGTKQALHHHVCTGPPLSLPPEKGSIQHLHGRGQLSLQHLPSQTRSLPIFIRHIYLRLPAIHFLLRRALRGPVGGSEGSVPSSMHTAGVQLLLSGFPAAAPRSGQLRWGI